MVKSVTVISGGMDSGVLAYHLDNKGWAQMFLSFDYGQRHKKELEYAKRIATNLGATHHIIDLTSVSSLISTSSLTNAHKEVPDGHYNENSMRSTVVPNRNAMMLAIAFAAASSWNAHYVSTGVHAGDRYNYPDCREEFIYAFQSMENKALEGFCSPTLNTPFVAQTKADIAKLGKELKVPFEQTWSCYKGGAFHCGRCGTCVERLEALHEAKVEDGTVYADPEFWRQAVANYAKSVPE